MKIVISEFKDSADTVHSCLHACDIGKDFFVNNFFFFLLQFYGFSNSSREKGEEQFFKTMLYII